MRSRAAAKPKKKENLYKTSLQTKLRYDSEAPPPSVADDFPRDLPTKLNGTATNKSLLYKLNPFNASKKRHSLAPGHELDPQRYLRSTQYGRASISSFSSRNNFNQQQQTPAHRQSIFSMPCCEEEENLLETTTIADLIRALESAHTDNVINSNSQDSTLKGRKHRKLGTDHLGLTSTSNASGGSGASRRNTSLVTLFQRRPTNSSHTIHDTTNRSRLYSCISTPPSSLAGDNSNNSRGQILGDENPFYRNPSVRRPAAALKRRFSVRPSNLEKAPGQFHIPKFAPVIASSIEQQAAQASLPFTRKLSWRPTPSSLAHSNESANINVASSNKKSKFRRQKSESTSTAATTTTISTKPAT